MKTKFRAEMHAFKCHTEFMIKVICNHNAGEAEIDLGILQGYVKAKAAQYPTLNDGRNEAIRIDNILHILEDGICYMSIIENKLHELEVPNEEVNEDEMFLVE